MQDGLAPDHAVVALSGPATPAGVALLIVDPPGLARRRPGPDAAPVLLVVTADEVREARGHSWSAADDLLVAPLEPAELELRAGRLLAAPPTRESSRWYRGLYEDAPIGYLAGGPDGHIVAANPAAAGLTGRTCGDLLGRHVLELYADSPRGAERARDAYRRSLAGEAIEGTELELLRPSGDTVAVRLHVQPVCDERGAVVGRRSMLIDVSREARAEAALAKTAHHLERAQHVARIGSWELDLAVGGGEWSLEMFRLTGFPPPTAPPLADFTAWVHPEDRWALARFEAAAVQTGEASHLDFRARGPGDEERWFHSTVEAHSDRSPRGAVLIGTLQDVTDRKRETLALE